MQKVLTFYYSTSLNNILIIVPIIILIIQTKLFSDLYLAKFLDTSAGLFRVESFPFSFATHDWHKRDALVQPSPKMKLYTGDRIPIKSYNLVQFGV